MNELVAGCNWECATILRRRATAGGRLHNRSASGASQRPESRAGCGPLANLSNCL